MAEDINATGGDPRYLKLLDELRELHIKKACDYGAGGDFLANCRGSEAFGVPAWIGTMIRAMDKVVRIKSFIANGKLENESLEDSLKDLAAYSLIALVLFREKNAVELADAYLEKVQEIVNPVNTDGGIIRKGDTVTHKEGDGAHLLVKYVMNGYAAVDCKGIERSFHCNQLKKVTNAGANNNP